MKEKLPWPKTLIETLNDVYPPEYCIEVLMDLISRGDTPPAPNFFGSINELGENIIHVCIRSEEKGLNLLRFIIQHNEELSKIGFDNMLFRVAKGNATPFYMAVGYSAEVVRLLIYNREMLGLDSAYFKSYGPDGSVLRNALRSVEGKNILNVLIELREELGFDAAFFRAVDRGGSTIAHSAFWEDKETTAMDLLLKHSAELGLDFEFFCLPNKRMHTVVGRLLSPSPISSIGERIIGKTSAGASINWTRTIDVLFNMQMRDNYRGKFHNMFLDYCDAVFATYIKLMEAMGHTDPGGLANAYVWGPHFAADATTRLALVYAQDSRGKVATSTNEGAADGTAEAAAEGSGENCGGALDGSHVASEGVESKDGATEGNLEETESNHLSGNEQSIRDEDQEETYSQVNLMGQNINEAAEELLMVLLPWIKDLPDVLQKMTLSSYSMQQILKILESTIDPHKLIMSQLSMHSIEERFTKEHEKYHGQSDFNQTESQTNAQVGAYDYSAFVQEGITTVGDFVPKHEINFGSTSFIAA